MLMWQKGIARNSLPHSVCHYWDVRPLAQGCHPLGLVANYLMDLGRVEWIWREACCKGHEVPISLGFFKIYSAAVPLVLCVVGLGFLRGGGVNTM